jgi:hypothetical protein
MGLIFFGFVGFYAQNPTNPKKSIPFNPFEG